MNKILYRTAHPGSRVAVISDVHGHAELLDKLISKLNPGGGDMIVLLGDIIECGAQSLKALRLAMELTESGRAVTLLGNWEYLFSELIAAGGSFEKLKARELNIARDFGSCLLGEMCAEAGLIFDANTDMTLIMPVIFTRFAREIEFIANLPIALDMDKWFFVHGGTDNFDPGYLADCAPLALLKRDAFASEPHAFDRFVVVGHWPVSLYDEGAPSLNPHIDREKRIASIDGGCGKKYDCQLNALILSPESPEVFGFIAVNGFTRITALEYQAASENPVSIHWTQRFVEPISQNGDYVRLRHIATGRVLEIPARMVFEFEGRMCTSDYTDNLLAVAPGDELSLVYTTSRGAFCKKDGISGWYLGAYE